MPLKSFKYWKREEVQKTFGLQRVFKMSLMEEWLDVDASQIDGGTRKELERLKNELAIFSTDWNEATLKFLFLAPFIRLVNFHIGIYHPFLEHSLTVNIGKDTASGKIDFMVAQGEQIPTMPFFCLHEYKPEEGTSNDPYGQLLIAMVAAQQENKKNGLGIPIYGMYNLGSVFFFLILNDKQYMRSKAYVAAEDEIFEIYSILRKSRSYIEKFGNSGNL